MNIFERVDELPGDDGWWHSDSRDSVYEVVKTLQLRGLTDDEIFNVIETMYCAIGNEYGM